MNKDIMLPLELSKRFQDAGFDWITDDYYELSTSADFTSLDFIIIPAAPASLFQKWLRDVHNIHMITKPFFDALGTDSFVCDVIRAHDGRVIKSEKRDTYELALNAALENALDLIP